MNNCIKFTPEIPKETSTPIVFTSSDYDIAAAHEIDPVKYFVDSSSARKAEVLKRDNLDEYCQMMRDHGQTYWQIGWESLPKYIDHKIYNTNTKKVGTVCWDKGPMIEYDGLYTEYLHANDFRHGNGYWIYSIGENYQSKEIR